MPYRPGGRRVTVMAPLAVPHALPAADVAARLAVDPERGLPEAEAHARFLADGPNVLPAGRRAGTLRIAARQFSDPLVALLLAAALVSGVIGERLEAAVIAAIVVLNAVLGFVQEAGAERALEALRRVAESLATVIREGAARVLPSAELVPGDLVVVQEGERVPADARLVDADRLQVDESALTGESVPVEKGVAPVAEEAPLAERSSLVFAGTAVTRGRAHAVVVATGGATQIGEIARLVGAASSPPTPLQRRLGGLSRSLLLLGLGLTAVLAAGMLLRGAGPAEAFLVGVAVAVAAVPEGLAAVVTIALAQGTHAMARRRTVVRRLAAIETLGETSVIATDKTGTLTLNRLHVAAVRPAEGRTEDEVLAAGAYVGTARLLGDGNVSGDPLDGAFLLAARERGLGLDARRLDVEPFDPVRRAAAAVIEDDGRRRVLVKGAPEVVLARAASADGGLRRLQRAVEAWAGEGLRVVAVAEAPDAPELAGAEERPLEVLGVVALHDPVRPGAADAVRSAREAGIRVVMVTGDHPATAAYVARAAGIDAADVHARVAPADKLRLVEGLQRAGEVVAVTGDGVNDAPALRAADVGVAMGRSGTEAAREAADVVVTDDDFATIVAAVEEGRRIGDNLRKFVAFLLSANLGEVVLFGIVVLGGLGVPMTVVQLLVVNLLTDGLPAVALTRDPASPETMRRAPVGVGSLFGRGLALALGVAGIAVGAAATAAYLAGRAFAPDAAQTMAFATIALSELVLVYSMRSAAAPAWRGPRNRALLAAVAGSAAVVVAAVYVPAANDVLATVPLHEPAAALVLLLALAPSALVELAKRVAGRRGRGAAEAAVPAPVRAGETAA
jgi:calcium-translocating P-type ATPase